MPKFCFPCIPSKSAQNPTTVALKDDQDIIVWQSDGRGYSKRQISKAVAVVLNGYDSTAAASSVDSACDPSTVDLWVQLYRPPFFEDGMVCPPALISWWMKELDRKNKFAQLQLQAQQMMIYGPSSQPNPGIFLNQSLQNNDPGFGTSYKPYTMFGNSGASPNTVIQTQQQTPTLQQVQAQGQQQSGGGGATNTLVINSPNGSQPNIRVFYQDDPNTTPKRISAIGQYNNTNSSIPQPQIQSQSQPQQLQRSSTNSQPQTFQYDSLGLSFQQQIDNTPQQQRLQLAEQALSTLQARAVTPPSTFQTQNQAIAQNQGQRTGVPRAGPQYSMN